MTRLIRYIFVDKLEWSMTAIIVALAGFTAIVMRPENRRETLEDRVERLERRVEAMATGGK